MSAALRPAGLARALSLWALALAASGCWGPERWPRESFTPEAWRSRAWEQRYVLYHGLAGSRLLDGATRERVVELLGEPDAAGPGPAMAYRVRKGAFSIFGWHQVRILDIRLDARGIVRAYFLRRARSWDGLGGGEVSR